MNWSIRLDGDPADLRELSHVFQTPDLLIAETTELGHPIFFIESTAFDSLVDDEAVATKGGELLSLISGAANLSLKLRRGLGLNEIRRRHPNGKQEIFVHVSSKLNIGVRMSASVTALNADGSSTTETLFQAAPVPAWVKKALLRPDAATALRLLSQEQTWVSLYKLYELVRDDVGNLVKAGWLAKKDESAFTHTANHPDATGDDARHAVLPGPPPPNPLSFDQAKALIETLVRRWFDAMP